MQEEQVTETSLPSVLNFFKHIAQVCQLKLTLALSKFQIVNYIWILFLIVFQSQGVITWGVLEATWGLF